MFSRESFTSNSPLFIHLIHNLEESGFITLLMEMVKEVHISDTDFDIILDFFYSILPFFYYQRYTAIIDQITPVIFSLFYSLLSVSSMWFYHL